MATVSPHNAEPPLILSIDAGTSSTRGLLFDARGRAVDGVAAQERYSVRSTEDGASEDDPDAALERIWRCVDAALQQAGPLAEAIGAVALDTLVTNTLAVDATDITPCLNNETFADQLQIRFTDLFFQFFQHREITSWLGCGYPAAAS